MKIVWFYGFILFISFTSLYAVPKTATVISVDVETLRKLQTSHQFCNGMLGKIGRHLTNIEDSEHLDIIAERDMGVALTTLHAQTQLPKSTTDELMAQLDKIFKYAVGSESLLKQVVLLLNGDLNTDLGKRFYICFPLKHGARFKTQATTPNFNFTIINLDQVNQNHRSKVFSSPFSHPDPKMGLVSTPSLFINFNELVGQPTDLYMAMIVNYVTGVYLTLDVISPWLSAQSMLTKRELAEAQNPTLKKLSSFVSLKDGVYVIDSAFYYILKAGMSYHTQLQAAIALGEEFPQVAESNLRNVAEDYILHFSSPETIINFLKKMGLPPLHRNNVFETAIFLYEALMDFHRKVKIDSHVSPNIGAFDGEESFGWQPNSYSLTSSVKKKSSPKPRPKKKNK